MNIAFRVDASDQIGTGHLMRCLTLAEALVAKGASIRFVCRHLSGTLASLILAKDYDVVFLQGSLPAGPLDELAHAHWLGTSQAQDSQETLQALSDKDWDWVIIDHYALDARWERQLRTVTKGLLVIDDLADRVHDCDVLLDQNFYSDLEVRYLDKVPASCHLLLGPRFALLRDEFFQLHEQVKPRIGPVKRVLVFFGGIDANNYTIQAIEALMCLKNDELFVDVVIGAQHPFKQTIESACKAYGFHCHVQTDKMAELMATADLAIGAGGSATWERCCLGLPTLAFSLADNQQKLTRDAAAQMLLYFPDSNIPNAELIGIHLKALMGNTALRSIISTNGLRLIDGMGTRRIIRRLLSNAIEMRRITIEDSAQLLEWRNHLSIRSVSRYKSVIDRETHQKWLTSVMLDPQRELLIGIRLGQPIGVVRFDLCNDEAEVSIYLVPGIKNAGTELLQSAESWLTENYPFIRRLNAEVLGANTASTQLFISSHYQHAATRYTKELQS